MVLSARGRCSDISVIDPSMVLNQWGVFSGTMMKSPLATRRGVPPPTVSLFGSQFLTWRGLPLIPSDKVPIEGNKTSVLLLRTGERRQGVVGLYQPTYAVYAATKAGVEAMTHVLANELRGRSITVNAVAPGPTATPPPLRISASSSPILARICA